MSSTTTISTSMSTTTKSSPTVTMTTTQAVSTSKMTSTTISTTTSKITLANSLVDDLPLNPMMNSTNNFTISPEWELEFHQMFYLAPVERFIRWVIEQTQDQKDQKTVYQEVRNG